LDIRADTITVSFRQNIFFKEERQRILEKIPEGEEPNAPSACGDAKTRKRKKRPHGKIGFENLAKVIGQRWQELTPEQVEYYKKKAEEDMKRYKDQMEEYLAKQDDGKKKSGGEDGEEDDDEDDVAPAPVKKQKKTKKPKKGE
jgi:HMG (high mobility group) box